MCCVPGSRASKLPVSRCNPTNAKEETTMALKLFYVPQTRAGRARWMLEELGVPYAIEKIDVQAKQNQSPEYLEKVHPLGHVPALHDSDGDVTMFESAAICMYLADKFAEKKL